VYICRSYIPAEDPDILLATLRRATPLVLRRFCTQQLQRRSWDLEMLQPPEAAAQVLQIGNESKRAMRFLVEEISESRTF